MSNRGRAVRVVGGRNVGCTGWINLDKPKPQQSYNVFLVMKNGTVAEKQVCDNNIEFEKKPNSYAEAIFQQHDDILLKMNQLVDALAMCKIENEQPAVVAIFTKTLDAAVKKHRTRIGNKAVHRDVAYGKPKEK